MIIDLAVDLAALIESTVTVQKVAVTPPNPAASDNCSAVYVWADQIFDSPIGVQARGDDAGCAYRRAYELRYRIDVCMPVGAGGREVTTAQFLDTSTELYDYADTVWWSAPSSFQIRKATGCRPVGLFVSPTPARPVRELVSGDRSTRPDTPR
jgi:hypothetical protein